MCWCLWVRALSHSLLAMHWPFCVCERVVQVNWRKWIAYKGWIKYSVSVRWELVDKEQEVKRLEITQQTRELSRNIQHQVWVSHGLFPSAASVQIRTRPGLLCVHNIYPTCANGARCVSAAVVYKHKNQPGPKLSVNCHSPLGSWSADNKHGANKQRSEENRGQAAQRRGDDSGRTAQVWQVWRNVISVQSSLLKTLPGSKS